MPTNTNPPNAKPRPIARIRIATAVDMASMIAVVNRAFAIEKFIEGTRTDNERMAEMMQRGEFLIGEDDEGCVVACVYTEMVGVRGYLGMLAVDPSRQREGIGRRIVDAAENRCRVGGCKQIDITVLSLRPDLPAFYHRIGYRETATEEFHPPRQLKAECYSIIMSKAL